jgi:hypothetical protein
MFTSLKHGSLLQQKYFIEMAGAAKICKKSKLG